jgi:hypothetical protein
MKEWLPVFKEILTFMPYDKIENETCPLLLDYAEKDKPTESR